MSDQSVPLRRRLLTRGSWPEAKRLAEILRMETVGGVLLLIAAAAAIVWANSPWSDAYHAVSEFAFGPEPLHLRPERCQRGRPTGCWRSSSSSSGWSSSASSSRVTFVTRRAPRCRSRLPSAEWSFPPRFTSRSISAAGHPENVDGWAVPIATDIAFALAVLAVLSTHLPTALRTFLLTLAVVDDLMAITVIAAFFTDHLSLAAAGAGAGPDRRCSGWPFSAACISGGCWSRWRWSTWALVHASGVHATVAGVLLGFTVPVLADDGKPTAERFEHRMRPVSAGFAVPVFAFFAAGVTVGGWSGLGASMLHPVTDRRDRRPGHWQTNRGLRHHLCVGQVHPRQPRRRPRVARRIRRFIAGWDRVHSFVIDR